MSTDAHAKYLAANDLLTGEVVFLAADGRWVRDLSEAELILDPAPAASRLRQATSRTDQVVGLTLVDALPGPAGPTPSHFRERIRATGPSNYPHGKQEREANV